ncbi:penicillin acylase family protein [Actinoplanes sp. NPDC051513]|uniref:penicillin acylase family protein n=1 Tax=Actinoplanes sp. NPDC051513 TaxID=3363908 RepID=UPI00379FF145
MSFFHNGFRAARITDMVRDGVARGPVDQADVVAMQADTTAIDAQFFTPIIVRALRSGDPRVSALAREPRIVEAAGRLARWNHTYPTGIPQGYDAADRDGRLGAPSPAEIDNSVAATIYALWRGRFVVNVFDRHVPAGAPSTTDFHGMQALRRVLATDGVGRSGIDFFAVPGIASAADRRDYLVLRSLADALDLAASDAFAPAFGGSTDQGHYRWGKLHRITLTSPLGAPYTIPSPGNRFGSPLPGLPGIPMDGGANVPDVSGHPLRADAPGKFTVSLIPIRRFVAEGAPGAGTR